MSGINTTDPYAILQRAWGCEGLCFTSHPNLRSLILGAVQMLENEEGTLAAHEYVASLQDLLARSVVNQRSRM